MEGIYMLFVSFFPVIYGMEVVAIGDVCGERER